MNEKDQLSNSFTKHNKSFYHHFKDRNLSILVEKGDLLDQQVDIIVNAANSSLILGGGVAGAILSKCGRSVQDDCSKIVKTRGRLEISESVHTTSHKKIPASFIIHAVGPRWTDYNDKKECYDKLKATFYNILMYAENILHEAKSIAIPLVSSGIFGIPRLLCCKALYFGIEEYLFDSDGSKRNLNQIRLINIDDETNLELVNFFDEKFSKIDGYLKPKPKPSDKIKKLDIKAYECKMCKFDIFGNQAIKLDCGCFYCVYCGENFLQGNECECKL